MEASVKYGAKLIASSRMLVPSKFCTLAEALIRAMSTLKYHNYLFHRCYAFCNPELVNGNRYQHQDMNSK